MPATPLPLPPRLNRTCAKQCTLVEVVLENSIEEFIERFREHAAVGTLYPQPEGSVLLEFVAGGQVMYLFDRTGPYTAKPGPGRVIVHPLILHAQPAEVQEEQLISSQISALEGTGQVIRTEKGFLVVQARIPLVCGLFSPAFSHFQVGDWITFQSQAPTHGFCLLK